jgi:hypothetical protein
MDKGAPRFQYHLPSFLAEKDWVRMACCGTGPAALSGKVPLKHLVVDANAIIKGVQLGTMAEVSRCENMRHRERPLFHGGHIDPVRNRTIGQSKRS